MENSSFELLTARQQQSLDDFIQEVSALSESEFESFLSSENYVLISTLAQANQVEKIDYCLQKVRAVPSNKDMWLHLWHALLYVARYAYSLGKHGFYLNLAISSFKNQFYLWKKSLRSFYSKMFNTQGISTQEQHILRAAAHHYADPHLHQQLISTLRQYHPERYSLLKTIVDIAINKDIVTLLYRNNCEALFAALDNNINDDNKLRVLSTFIGLLPSADWKKRLLQSFLTHNDYEVQRGLVRSAKDLQATLTSLLMLMRYADEKGYFFIQSLEATHYQLLSVILSQNMHAQFYQLISYLEPIKGEQYRVFMAQVFADYLIIFLHNAAPHSAMIICLCAVILTLNHPENYFKKALENDNLINFLLLRHPSSLWLMLDLAWDAPSNQSRDTVCDMLTRESFKYFRTEILMLKIGNLSFFVDRIKKIDPSQQLLIDMLSCSDFELIIEPSIHAQEDIVDFLIEQALCADKSHQLLRNMLQACERNSNPLLTSTIEKIKHVLPRQQPPVLLLPESIQSPQATPESSSNRPTF